MTTTGSHQAWATAGPGGGGPEDLGPGCPAAYGLLGQVQCPLGNDTFALADGSGEVGVVDPQSSRDQAGDQVLAGLPVPARQLLPAPQARPDHLGGILRRDRRQLGQLGQAEPTSSPRSSASRSAPSRPAHSGDRQAWASTPPGKPAPSNAASQRCAMAAATRLWCSFTSWSRLSALAPRPPWSGGRTGRRPDAK